MGRQEGGGLLHERPPLRRGPHGVRPDDGRRYEGPGDRREGRKPLRHGRRPGAQGRGAEGQPRLREDVRGRVLEEPDGGDGREARRVRGGRGGAARGRDSAVREPDGSLREVRDRRGLWSGGGDQTVRLHQREHQAPRPAAKGPRRLPPRGRVLRRARVGALPRGRAQRIGALPDPRATRGREVCVDPPDELRRGGQDPRRIRVRRGGARVPQPRRRRPGAHPHRPRAGRGRVPRGHGRRDERP